MTTHDPFELELRATLRAAFDETSGPHPTWADSPARQAVERAGRTGTRRWPLRLLAVAAMLAIGGGTAVLVGAPRPPELDVMLAPAGPIPERLVGKWHGGTWALELDLGGPPGVAPQDTLEYRRATGYLPIDGDHGAIVLGATSECPEARYRVAGVSEGQLRLARLTDSCPGREKRTDQAWTTHTMELPWNPPANMRQASLAFTEPFSFPVIRSSPDVQPVVLGQGAGLGRLWVGNGWWRGWFLDDQALPRDMANPGAGAMADVPSNAVDLAAWLRANGTLADFAPTAVTVDGRTAVRFDLANPLAMTVPEDWTEADEPVVWAARVYLIPTRDDAILVWLKGDMPADYDEAEELLRTITFD